MGSVVRSPEYAIATVESETATNNMSDLLQNVTNPANTAGRTGLALGGPPHMVVILCLAYTTVFILAVVNNSLVVTVIYRNQQMRNVTNYFIANLAVADITVSFLVLPITLMSNVFKDWHFGEFLCKAVPYLQGVAVSASVNTLVAVAVERYLIIFYPRSNLISPQKAGIIIAVIWFIPMCILIPWPTVYVTRTFSDETRSITFCLPEWESPANQKAFFLGAVFLTCYLLPLLGIVLFYSMIGLRVWKRNVAGIRGSQAEKNIQQHKIRIVRMLVFVAVMFTLSWVPLYVIKLRILFGPRFDNHTKLIVMMYIRPVAQWLGSANSCINPFIYCYFSEQFRKYITELVKEIFCLKKKSRSTKMATML